MSTLGQKETYAMQQTVSALSPIATAKADISERSCPTSALMHLRSPVASKSKYLAAPDKATAP
jgi:hypothetical protein